MYMQWEEILFKSKPSKKQISLSKISCDRKVEVDLSILFLHIFTLIIVEGLSEKQEVISYLTTELFIGLYVLFVFRWVNGNCVSAQQKGVWFLSASSHSKSN